MTRPRRLVGPWRVPRARGAGAVDSRGTVAVCTGRPSSRVRPSAAISSTRNCAGSACRRRARGWWQVRVIGDARRDMGEAALLSIRAAQEVATPQGGAHDPSYEARHGDDVAAAIIRTRSACSAVTTATAAGSSPRLSSAQARSIGQSTAKINLWTGSERSGRTVASLIRWQRRSQHDDADHSAGGQPCPECDRPVLELLAARAASPGPAAAALGAMNGMKIVTNTAPILASRGYGASLVSTPRRAFPRHRSNGFSLFVNWVSQ